MRPSPKAHPATGKAGFTILELLVTIMLLGILATLLMPGMQQARAQAVQAGCLANLRSVYQQLLLYAMDHDDYLPGAPRQLTGLPLDVNGDAPTSPLPALFAANGLSVEVLRCPAQRIEREFAAAPTTLARYQDELTTRSYDYFGSPDERMLRIDAIGGELPILSDRPHAYRHSGRFNTVFGDGHAEALSPAERAAAIERWTDR